MWAAGGSDAVYSLPVMLPLRVVIGLATAFAQVAAALVGADASALASSVTTSAAVGTPSASANFIRDAASHVNLFIGTTNGGHTFPGKQASVLRELRL